MTTTGSHEISSAEALGRFYQELLEQKVPPNLADQAFIIAAQSLLSDSVILKPAVPEIHLLHD